MCHQIYIFLFHYNKNLKNTNRIHIVYAYCAYCLESLTFHTFKLKMSLNRKLITFVQLKSLSLHLIYNV